MSESVIISCIILDNRRLDSVRYKPLYTVPAKNQADSINRVGYLQIFTKTCVYVHWATKSAHVKALVSQSTVAMDNVFLRNKRFTL